MTKLLVVDDSVAIRGVISFVLRARGYECIEASDGGEALDMLEGGQVDAIISDLWMPGMNGLDFLKRVRVSVGERFVPFLVLTTDSDPAMHRELVEAGATCVINKPVKPEKLVSAVTRALGA